MRKDSELASPVVLNELDIPTSVDWRAAGALTPIKN